MDDLLSQLLCPVSGADFFQHFSDRKHLHIRRSSQEFYEGIFSLRDLDAAFQSEMLPAAAFNVVTGSFRHSIDEWSRSTGFDRGQALVARPERLLQCYLQGATVILNRAHETLPSLAKVCRLLARRLRFPVHANVYITPPNSRGFGRHADGHEVLVLQISGVKTWQLFPEESAPIEINLNTGDLLYVPRGLIHEAECRDQSSIHITIGLYPSYGFRLIDELGVVAREDALQQRPFFDDSAGSAAGPTEDELNRGIAKLLNEITVSGLKQRQLRFLVDHQITGWPDRLLDVLRLPDITPETIVKSREEAVALIAEDDEDKNKLHVHFAGRHIGLPRFLGGSCDFILREEPFAIRDIPGLLSDNGKIELAKEFLQAGVLQIVRLNGAIKTGATHTEECVAE